MPEAALQIVTLGAIPTVLDHASLGALARASSSQLSKPLEVFVKIDTGLGRLGIPHDEALELILAIVKTPSLQLAGIYSHAGSSSDARAEEQFARMKSVLSQADALGIKIPLRIIASTPHVLRMPQMWLNAVDPGRLLFGIKQPIDAFCPPGSIRGALRGLRTRLIQVKPVTAGDPPDYRASGVAKYGVLPFGWADGFLADAYRNSGALVRGVRVPFLKGLSTEHSVIDLTALPDSRAGDAVTLLGTDGDASIDVERFAKDAGILVSEVTRRFHRHLPYVYFRNGVPTHVMTLSGVVDGPF